jgi:hypothetical protein
LQAPDTGKSFDGEGLRVGTAIEVAWAEDDHFYDCNVLQVNVEAGQVFVSWVDGEASEDCWVDFSSCRTPQTSQGVGSSSKVTSFPSAALFPLSRCNFLNHVINFDLPRLCAEKLQSLTYFELHPACSSLVAGKTARG